MIHFIIFIIILENQKHFACRTQEHYSETFVTEREFKNNKTRNRVLSENVSKDDSNIVLMGFAMFAVVSFFLLFDFIDHINHEYKKPVK